MDECTMDDGVNGYKPGSTLRIVAPERSRAYHHQLPRLPLLFIVRVVSSLYNTQKKFSGCESSYGTHHRRASMPTFFRLSAFLRACALFYGSPLQTGPNFYGAARSMRAGSRERGMYMIHWLRHHLAAPAPHVTRQCDWV
jgi:hypothetical protein